MECHVLALSNQSNDVFVFSLCKQLLSTQTNIPSFPKLPRAWTKITTPSIQNIITFLDTTPTCLGLPGMASNRLATNLSIPCFSDARSFKLLSARM